MKIALSIELWGLQYITQTIIAFQIMQSMAEQHVRAFDFRAFQLISFGAVVPMTLAFPLLRVMSMAVGMPSGYLASYSGPPCENLQLPIAGYAQRTSSTVI